MRRRIAALAVVAFIALPGCAGLAEDPCEGELLMIGKVPIQEPLADGTRVEVDGRPAECQDGEAVPIR